MVLQYLERKPNIIAPTVDKVISRKMIEHEYDLLGYTVLRVIAEDSSLRYGSYILSLFRGPILLEDMSEDKRDSRMTIKVTLSHPN